MMECIKNLPHYALNPAMIASSRLMCFTAFKCAVSRAKFFFATPAKRNTAKFASLALLCLSQEVVDLKSAQTVRQKLSASIAATLLKKQTTKTETIALSSAAVSTSKNCTLVATTLQRLHAMGLNVASVIRRSRHMFTTLIYLVGSKKLTGKGVTTT